MQPIQRRRDLNISRGKIRLKLRHAAVLALVGWYLMAPPPHSDINLPLNQWMIWNSYDSAKECENQRRKNLDEATALAKHESSDSQTMDNDTERIIGIIQSVCVSSDDPRLKPN